MATVLSIAGVLKRGQGYLHKLVLTLGLDVSRQQEEKIFRDGVKDTSKVASQENHVVFFFFLTSR